MSLLLPRSSVPALLLLLVALAVFIFATTSAQIALENGDVFSNIQYTSATTYDANAKLKDETAYSSTILWKSCKLSNAVVTLKGTFDTTQTFATSLYLMIDSATFSGSGKFYFNDLPPNSYIHAVQSTGTGVYVSIFDIHPTTESNNITTLIDSSTVQYSSNTDAPFVNLAVPNKSPFIVTHLHNAILTSAYNIFSTTTCTKGSTIFLEKITCNRCNYDLIMLTEITQISEQSALILKEITIGAHQHPSRDGLIRTGTSLNIDASSVLAVIDIDLTENFSISSPLRLFYSTAMSGSGAIVFLRIKMGPSGLDDMQPTDNRNFWVSAKKTSSRVMTTAELRTAKFNVNTNNVINWDGTGSNGKCVQVGLALPRTATYELVNGKCEATCPKGNYLQPACTPRAECTGVPNCEACYAHPKTMCLECLPHTTPENSDTKCTCPIRECIECPTATLCTRCTQDYKYSAEMNSCFQCTIDKCTVCNSDGQCSTCEDGYKVYNNQCIACDIGNCAFCKEAGKCAECAADYKPTADLQTCFHCTTPFCTECGDDDVCGVCDDGYYLLESSTDPTKNKCVRCTIDVEKCEVCEIEGVCSQCITDHKPTANGKQCYNCTMPFCTECRADGVCSTCADGYSLHANECVRCRIDVEKCETCQMDSVCLECIAGHKPTANGATCFQCPVSGCKECSADGICATCEDGYTLVVSDANPTDNKCVRCGIDIPQCAACEIDGVCSECNTDYKPTANGKQCYRCTTPFCTECRVDDVCAECKDGYSLVISAMNPAENKCVRCAVDVPQCATCEADGICSQCNADYKPASGGEKCFQCTVAHCQECSSDGVCAACTDGYSLVVSDSTPTENKCVRCRIDVPNCAECKTDGICSTCDEGGYTLSSDGRRCTACDVDECQRCDLPGVCALCSAGMTATDGGQCTPCAIENCTHCSASNVCAVCSCGEVPGDDGDTCVPCSAANCRYCDPAGNGTACAECMDGYEASGAGVCHKAGVADWVYFIIVLLISVVLITAVILVYVWHQRRLLKAARMAADADERRRNRQRRAGSVRQHMEIAVVDLGDIENAASGVRDIISATA